MAVAIPWWLKMGAKLMLSRLPFDYRVWQRLGLFRHGHMDQVGYPLGIFETHVARAGLGESLRGKTIIELGPGDSIATAMIAACHGASAILIDAGAFASADMRFYRNLRLQLSAIGLQPPDISGAKDLHGVLEACRAKYLTEGVRSLEELEAESVDFVFSHAVLEHVRRQEFADTMRECRRVLSRTGAASHTVDLRDHLGGSLNNLRFSQQWWESDFFVKSGFYTNRIRYREMLALFGEVGFDVEVCGVSRWSQLPLPKRLLDRAFAVLEDEDLSVAGFDVLLRP